MSTFEVVRGVEGDCLVLDGTRICGPKPWGGGRVIDTFRTDEVYEAIDKNEYRKLQAENAKLRELCASLYEFAMSEYPDGTELNFADRIRELGIEEE